MVLLLLLFRLLLYLSMGVIGSLIGGLFGVGSTIATNRANAKNVAATNQANKEIAQMNNEWSAEQAAIQRDWESDQVDKQNKWNLEQWNRENEYNSASAQRERLEAAGLNPYNMMGGDAGTAGSITSASPNGVQPPTAQAYQHVPTHYEYDFSSVMDAINSYYQNRNTEEDTRGKSLDNNIVEHFGPDEAKARIANLLGGRYELLTSEYQNGRKNAAIDLLGAGISKTMKEVDAIDSYTEMNYARAFAERMSGKGQRILNKYLDAREQADLSIRSASIYRLYTEGKLNEATAEQRIASTILMQAETKGRKISNRIARQTAASVITAMNEENEHRGRYYSQLRKYARALADNDANLSNIEKDLKDLESAKRYDRTQSYGKLMPYFNAINDAFKILRGRFDQ